MKLHETASQTVGPYVHIGCMPNAIGLHDVYPEDLGARMRGESTEGQKITIEGIIRDGAGAPLTDALVEIWQADARGRYGADGSGFTGWGRAAADAQSGVWRFETIKPGAVEAMAPHITFWIAARGINMALHTRMYFPEDETLQASDPVLAGFVPAPRRNTLIAQKTADFMYQFNIHLQGSEETVFFDV
ncbi:protocatechuate 3,4-dioxygenase subunit alpha [Roseobacter sinensis]|uniref:Protocatechuate 3,4-dioxygenase subunit alpha n=1 Tax=Roseobacter sinensis TaxID=2931391 RepID=A0ABT3BB55_9RHOB|nr:protocatechuate 3,4-dioxygenase subunit alpha [Roseobacter sp. WL0113]MCV3270823.1 protocatechuate 3,4-dioxygenase subunit alpha [Roseobacter sp. WL0113]